MEMCKRLNPNVEVPDVTDLIQQLELMLQSDTTERKLLFNDNRGKDVSILFHSLLEREPSITPNIFIHY